MAMEVRDVAQLQYAKQFSTAIYAAIDKVLLEIDPKVDGDLAAQIFNGDHQADDAIELLTLTLGCLMVNYFDAKQKQEST